MKPLSQLVIPLMNTTDIKKNINVSISLETLEKSGEFCLTWRSQGSLLKHAHEVKEFSRELEKLRQSYSFTDDRASAREAGNIENGVRKSYVI